MVTKGYSMQASYSDKLQTNMLAPFLVILSPFLVFLILFSCDITVNVFFALLGNIAMRARSNPWRHSTLWFFVVLVRCGLVVVWWIPSFDRWLCVVFKTCDGCLWSASDWLDFWLLTSINCEKKQQVITLTGYYLFGELTRMIVD